MSDWWYIYTLANTLAARGCYDNLCRQRVALPRLKRLRWLEFGIEGDRCVCVCYHKMFFAVVDTKEIPYIGHSLA